MTEFLHTIPDAAALAIIVTVLVLGAVAAPQIGRRLLRLPESKVRDEAAFDAYKAILAMAGFVLAFSLVQVTENLRKDQAVAGREGTLITTVDRTLLRLGTPKAVGARPLLAAFGRSEVEDEWPGLAHSLRNPVTDERARMLSREARSIEPTTPRQEAMYAELIKALDDLADARELLIQDTEIRLPDFFWVVTGAFLSIAFLLAVMTEISWTRAAGLGGTAAGIAILMAFVMIVDEPFKGQTSVGPDDIAKALVLNHHRV